MTVRMLSSVLLRAIIVRSQAVEERENPPKSLPFSQELETLEVWPALRILSVMQPNTCKTMMGITSLVTINFFKHI